MLITPVKPGCWGRSLCVLTRTLSHKRAGNPEEGELRPQLLDRFGMHAEIRTVKDANLRVQIVEQRAEFDSNPAAFRAAYADKQKELTDKLVAARRVLKDVRVRCVARRALDCCWALQPRSRLMCWLRGGIRLEGVPPCRSRWSTTTALRSARSAPSWTSTACAATWCVGTVCRAVLATAPAPPSGAASAAAKPPLPLLLQVTNRAARALAALEGRTQVHFTDRRASCIVRAR